MKVAPYKQTWRRNTLRRNNCLVDLKMCGSDSPRQIRYLSQSLSQRLEIPSLGKTGNVSAARRDSIRDAYILIRHSRSSLSSSLPPRRDARETTQGCGGGWDAVISRHVTVTAEQLWQLGHKNNTGQGCNAQLRGPSTSSEKAR